MANKAYCRFRNTLKDLQDCADALAEINYGDFLHQTEELSEEEDSAARCLIDLCGSIYHKHEAYPTCGYSGDDV